MRLNKINLKRGFLFFLFASLFWFVGEERKCVNPPAILGRISEEASQVAPQLISTTGNAIARAIASIGIRSAVAGHSHNDYEQDHPLTDALNNDFYSVEADIWIRGSEILVSHLGFLFKGSLEKLYLEPLQERVNRLGSVYGDGKPFLLWIELKEQNPRLVAELQKTLEKYPMLTRFTDRKVDHRPVTVVLTGIERAKENYTKNFKVRYACRDSEHFSTVDPQADNRWCWYAMDWTEFFTWDGNGVMPPWQKKYLRAFVAAIHSKGRKVRFFGAPDTEAAWRESYNAGVDLIETDSLNGFATIAHDLNKETVR